MSDKTIEEPPLCSPEEMLEACRWMVEEMPLSELNNKGLRGGAVVAVASIDPAFTNMKKVADRLKDIFATLSAAAVARGMDEAEARRLICTAFTQYWRLRKTESEPDMEALKAEIDRLANQP